LKYNFRDQRLTINLNNDSYAVSNQRFKIISNKNFGFNATQNQLSYFNGSTPVTSLQITTDKPLTININQWSADKIEWQQTATQPSAKALAYAINQLNPNTSYTLAVNGKVVQKIKSDANGNLSLSHLMTQGAEKINIYHGN
jgi:hypothetical protein